MMAVSLDQTSYLQIPLAYLRYLVASDRDMT
jgi:hypothetical protein